MSDAVDVDLLADYVGGALDGTPEADRVAALVAASPEWASEHELLVAALAATADDLAEYAAAAAEPMPAAVSERLLAALAAEGPLDASAPSPAAGPEVDDTTFPASPGRRSADGGARLDQRAPADGRPGGADGGHAGPARNRRRRRRWATWAAPVLVAAAVAGFAGVWINQASETANTAADSAGSSAVSPESGGAPARAPASVLGAPAVPQAASGRDYTGAQVAGGFRGSRATASTPGSTMSEDQEGSAAQSVDPSLRRLTAPAALSICVEAIAQAHGQGPITVQAADFASYEGQPAVVVFFTDAAGARWGWAAGPDCGPAGADTLFSAPIR